MKKSLVALAALSAISGVASAQSSVTLYGRVDEAYSKRSGYKVNGINDTQNSRVGFKGVEDLGDGLKAVFNLETQLAADTGAQGDTPFWNRRAIVGLQGGFGSVVLGREYTPAYLLVEKAADPWGNDTYASNEAIVRGGVSKPNGSNVGSGHNSNGDGQTGAIDSKRQNNSVTYSFSAEGFTGSVQYGAKEDGVISSTSQGKNAYSLAAAYAAGPLFVGLGYSSPGNPSAAANRKPKWTTLAGSYDLGVVKLGAFFGTGTNKSNKKVNSWLLSGSAPLGNGQLRFSYGQLKNKDLTAVDAGSYDTTLSTKVISQLGVGYHYSLSKRTTVYADVVNDSKGGKGADTSLGGHGNKTGYDFGIRHDF